jgi:hypothetical protein
MAPAPVSACQTAAACAWAYIAEAPGAREPAEPLALLLRRLHALRGTLMLRLPPAPFPAAARTWEEVDAAAAAAPLDARTIPADVLQGFARSALDLCRYLADARALVLERWAVHWGFLAACDCPVFLWFLVSLLLRMYVELARIGSFAPPHADTASAAFHPAAALLDILSYPTWRMGCDDARFYVRAAAEAAARLRALAPGSVIAAELVGDCAYLLGDHRRAAPELWCSLEANVFARAVRGEALPAAGSARPEPRTLAKLVEALELSGEVSAAVALEQFHPSRDLDRSVRRVVEARGLLDAAYFPHMFDVPLLEILLHRNAAFESRRAALMDALRRGAGAAGGARPGDARALLALLKQPPRSWAGTEVDVYDAADLWQYGPKIT